MTGVHAPPPRVAYLVLAHTAPRHLARLVAALDSPSSAVFVHLDAETDEASFSDVLGPRARVTRERVAVRWGDFSQVDAILVLLREAMADPRQFVRFVLISGVDHPLRSAAGLDRFFAAHPGQQFMNLVRMPDGDVGKPMSKLTTYQFRPRRSRFGRAVWTVLMALGRRVHRRDVDAALGGFVPYGGSTWWAITRGAAELILSFPDREPRAARFFRRVVCPDESYFHTIIGNSPFRDVTVANVTYTDWSAGGANPGAITDDHLDALASQAASDEVGVNLFARKFADDDGELIGRLTRLIAAYEHTAAVAGARR
jgi:Core-2/I-Branching enzyme